MKPAKVTRGAPSWKPVVVAVIVMCLLGTGSGVWGLGALQVPGEAEARERVTAIIRDTLRRGELTSGSVKVVTRAMPSSEAVEEVRRYGDAAVSALEHHLRQGNERERDLALRLLGSLGGKRIVKPLREIILNHPSAGFRRAALRWITQAPWEAAAVVLREAAVKDPDREVRREAESILRDHAPK